MYKFNVTLCGLAVLAATADLKKAFRFGETVDLEFRAEYFNALIKRISRSQATRWARLNLASFRRRALRVSARWA